LELELRKIKIKDVQFAGSTHVADGTLFINVEQIRDLLLSDERIDSVTIDLARPGESVRIVPVKDVIEPRAKLSGGDAFPGIDGKISAVGCGSTLVLSGAAVLTTGPIVGFQEGIVDMSGPLMEYTPFAYTCNVVISIEKRGDVTPYEHEEAVRIAGVKTAHFIARQAMDAPVDDTEVYEWLPVWKKAERHPGLPKVVYVYQCISQGLLHDTYIYGRDSKKMNPTVISPLAVFDGAIVSGNCVSPGSKTTTYHHQNNAVIRELFKRDGKELNFIGVVVSPFLYDRSNPCLTVYLRLTTPF
jgi:glycine reductase